MPASKLVLKIYSTDCLQDLLSGNSRSGLLHKGMEAGTVSLMRRFAVPQFPRRRAGLRTAAMVSKVPSGFQTGLWWWGRSEVKLGTQVSRSRLGSARGQAQHRQRCRLRRNPGKGLSVNAAPKPWGQRGPQWGSSTVSELTFNTGK